MSCSGLHLIIRHANPGEKSHRATPTCILQNLSHFPRDMVCVRPLSVSCMLSGASVHTSGIWRYWARCHDARLKASLCIGLQLSYIEATTQGLVLDYCTMVTMPGTPISIDLGFAIWSPSQSLCRYYPTLNPLHVFPGGGRSPPLCIDQLPS